jgi:hypothetical protein
VTELSGWNGGGPGCSAQTSSAIASDASESLRPQGARVGLADNRWSLTPTSRFIGYHQPVAYAHAGCAASSTAVPSSGVKVVRQGERGIPHTAAQ